MTLRTKTRLFVLCSALLLVSVEWWFFGKMQGALERIEAAEMVQAVSSSSSSGGAEESETSVVRSLDQAPATGFVTLAGDAGGHLQISLTKRREAYRSVMGIVRTFFLLLVPCSILSAGILLVVLERSILNRIAEIRERVLSIASRGTPNAVLATSGRDELSGLVGAVNEMLEAIHKTQSANSAKFAFLAKMNHEIRTPLSTIVTAIELVKRGGIDRKLEPIIAALDSAVCTLRQLVSDVLDISRIEAGKFVLHSAPFSLRLLVEETAAHAKKQDASKDQRLSVHIDERLPEHWIGDAGRLRQVLTNLLANAIKYSPPGGEIRVAVEGKRADDQHYVLAFEVADTGISREVLPSIFDGCAGKEGSMEALGVGLNLAVCRELVGLMKGEIAVNSKPGAGSVFRFDCRVRVDERARQEPERGAVCPLGGLRVMLVDDLAAARMITTQLLENAGAAVEQASDGEEAVKLFKARRFDVILMDCMMPVMDGISATAKIRELEGGGPVRVPVVALTAKATSANRDACFAAGMDEYLEKPFSGEELIGKILAVVPAVNVAPGSWAEVTAKDA